MSKKSLWEDPSMRHMKKSWNSDPTSTGAPLPYSSTTVKVVELDKFTLSDMKSLQTFR